MSLPSRFVPLPMICDIPYEELRLLPQWNTRQIRMLNRLRRAFVHDAEFLDPHMKCIWQHLRARKLRMWASCQPGYANWGPGTH